MQELNQIYNTIKEIAKEIKRRQELEISKYLSERKPRKD